MKSAGRNFEDDLIGQLKNPEFAAHYLSEILNDSSDGQKERILIALKRMAKAYGVRALTQEIGRSPKALYISLSKKGNPTLETFLAILNALGIQLKAAAAEPTGHVAKRKRVANT
ncbi:addiction module antidote protein [Bdellovibrionota bacterium FG-2]